MKRILAAKETEGDTGYNSTALIPRVTGILQILGCVAEGTHRRQRNLLSIGKEIPLRTVENAHNLLVNALRQKMAILEVSYKMHLFLFYEYKYV